MTSAVLFYGFNLGDLEGGDWLIDQYEGTDTEPEWVAEAERDDDDDDGYLVAMGRRLLIASGAPEESVPYSDSIELESELAKRCGVRIITCGHSNTQFYGLALEESVQRADDWTPVEVTTITKGRYHKLVEALEVLGIKPAKENPSWILAPNEY